LPPPSLRDAKAISERVPAPVLAALVTGVFALLTTVATSYLPSRVNLEQVRLQATQTAEGRNVQATLDAMTAGGAASPGAAMTTTVTVMPLSSVQALPADETATWVAEASITPTVTSTPTATSTPTPRKGSHQKRGDEGSQK
jgi:hypothetical protein